MFTKILLVNPQFKDLNPISLGFQDCKSGHKFGPYIRDYFLIHYVKNGTGVFDNGSGQYRVSKGQIFIIRPGETTTYTADEEEPWSYIWIGFDGALASKFFALNSPVMDYPYNTFFDLCNAEAYSNMREEFVTSKIFELLSNLFREETHKTDYVGQAENYIKANCVRPISAEEVASTVGLSLRYLSRLFKQSTGSGVQDYIITTRINQAKKFLKEGYTVQEASRQSGYQDVFNFSKAFKKKTGLSPSAYQKSQRLLPK